MIMKLSSTGALLIKHFEKLCLRAYPDPKTGGKPFTVGWGHTGLDVNEHTVWTEEKSNAIFLADIREFENDVNDLVEVEVTQPQFDALVSFAYNCGADIDADDKPEGLGDSTLLKKLNTGDYEGAADEFLKWISRGSPVEKGLRRRRAIEREYFLTGKIEL